jgi:hypothetical protein
MYKNILFADKFNFLQTNLFGQDVIFHFNLVASQVFEYNFSQLNCYRIDKFPLELREYEPTTPLPLSLSKFNRGVRQMFEDMEISVK